MSRDSAGFISFEFLAMIESEMMLPDTSEALEDRRDGAGPDFLITDLRLRFVRFAMDSEGNRRRCPVVISLASQESCLNEVGLVTTPSTYAGDHSG